MTSAVDAAASAWAVGQRSSQASQRRATREACVCCSITSETRIAYGSRVSRHGSSRPRSAYQSSSASLTRETLDSVSAVCFDLDSSPPVPVISGAAVSHDDLVLEARDGNRFAAFLATPDEPAGKGIVILPDVRGLYRFYEELALRFAERGHTAIAIDYFGRTAGAGKRGEEFEYRPHVEAVTPEQI